MNQLRPFSRQTGRRFGAALGMMVLLAVATASAQQAPVSTSSIFSISDRGFSGKGVQLLSTNRAQSLDLNMAAFRKSAASEMRITDLQLAPGLTVDLNVEEWDIFEDDAHLVFGTEQGEKPMKITTRMYRGTVAGDPHSDVYLAFADGGFLGHVRTYDKEYELSTDVEATAPAGVIPVISYPTDALLNELGKCGITDENIDEFGGNPLLHYRHNEKAGAALAAAEGIQFAVVGAWEGDVEYLGLFGGNEGAAADYMAQVIGEVSSAFERDLSAQLTIGHMKIWTSASADGYPYKEGANMAIALRETRDYWREPAQADIKYAFVHTMSGKSWTNPIGIAFLDVLCRDGRAGSYSAITYNNPARDRKVVAHEVGHNFGSPHTHSCGWDVPNGPGAIDQCAPAEGGSCFSGSTQSVGTIMSYCSQETFEFHPLVQALIFDNLAATECDEISQARKLEVATDLILFADESLGNARDSTLTGYFSNIGFNEITVTEVIITGDEEDQFEILTDLTTPFTIESGGTKDLEIRYKAESAAPAEMNIVLKHDGLNGDIKIKVEGYASDAKPNFLFGGIDGSEDVIDWGEQFQGLEIDKEVTGLFGNYGLSSETRQATLYITDVRIEGPDDDKFAFEIVQGTAPMQLGSAETRVGVLRFHPLTTGEFEAYLVVESNSGGQPGHLDSLLLRGNSKLGPVMQLAIHDLIIDFGDVEQATEPVTKEFTPFFTNIGGEVLDYDVGLTITQGEDRVFYSENVGSHELEAGSSNSLNFTFQPVIHDPVNGDVTAGLGLKRGYLHVQGYYYLFDENEFMPLGPPDTIHVVGNIIAPSGVHGNLEPDENFYVTASSTTGGDLSFWLAPLKAERHGLYIMSVLDVNGREVYRSPGRFEESGRYWNLDASNWASGTYYIRVSTEQGIRTRKATVTK